MRYTVTWHPSAEADLARIWVGADDQMAVSQAANTMERLLASNPRIHGEDFYGDWLLVQPPLAVVFTVIEDDLRVEILQVWSR
jgi:plasmid stabilization system protein ParE